MKFVLLIILLGSFVFAQDELGSEIQKLESGNVEQVQGAESVETVEEDLEQELAQEPPAPQETDPIVDSAEEPVLEEAPADEAEAPVEEIVAPDTLPEQNFESVDPVVEEDSQEKVAPVVTEDPTPEETLEPQQTASFDAQGSDFEARLNRIYNQFYSEALSEDAWKQIAGEKINESYTVQSGDTLWDISVTFFGNGHYWPKVWQLNDDITNPHLISAGYQLKFVPGTLKDAPQLNITDGTAEAPPEPVVADESQSAAPEEELTPVIPPPSKKSRSVLQSLPPSLPMLVSKKYAEFDNDGFSRQQSRAAIKSTDVFLTSYISDSKPEKLGSVVESDIGDVETVGVYDTVYVKIDQSAQPNEKFVIYNLGEQIRSKDSGRKGYQVFCHAEIRIIEKVNEDKNIYKALVTKSVFPAKVGAMLMKGSIPLANAEETGASGSTTGEIIGGDYEDERYLFGTQQVVYIDRGTEDGVQVGSIYSVRKNNRLRNPSSLVKEMRTQIAKIKVVKTAGQFSTAIVLNSNEEVRVGDKFTAASGGAAPIMKDIIEEQQSEQLPESESEEVERDEFIEE